MYHIYSHSERSLFSLFFSVRFKWHTHYAGEKKPAKKEKVKVQAKTKHASLTQLERNRALGRHPHRHVLVRGCPKVTR